MDATTLFTNIFSCLVLLVINVWVSVTGQQISFSQASWNTFSCYFSWCLSKTQLEVRSWATSLHPHSSSASEKQCTWDFSNEGDRTCAGSPWAIYLPMPLVGTWGIAGCTLPVLEGVAPRAIVHETLRTPVDWDGRGDKWISSTQESNHSKYCGGEHLKEKERDRFLSVPEVTPAHLTGSCWTWELQGS